MRNTAPFQTQDLAELGRFLARGMPVIPMRRVHEGIRDPNVIALRHDVDNAIEPAVEMAAWEAARGYRSTYFILHTAPYWHNKPLLRESLDTIAGYGHEIGIHNNALAEAWRTGEDPRAILAAAIHELRELGHDVTGTVAHGDPDCYGPDGNVRFVNDQLFTECRRLYYTDPVEPVPLDTFALDYDANWLPRGNYLSDSGGRWSQPFTDVEAGFPFPGQLHMLVHPDWWPEAFLKAAA